MTALAALLAACAVGVLLAPSPARLRLAALRVSTDATSLGTAGVTSSTAAAADNPPLLTSRPARAAASLLCGLATAGLLGGWFAIVGGCVIAGVAWVMLGRLSTSSQPDESPIVTALAADLLLAAIRAGCSPVMAADIVGTVIAAPVGAALRADAVAARLGASDRAWQHLLESPQWSPLGRALKTSLAHGTSPTAALERVARDARDGCRWDGEAKARSVGARAAAPLGLCFLPAFVLVAIVPIVVTSFR